MIIGRGVAHMVERSLSMREGSGIDTRRLQVHSLLDGWKCNKFSDRPLVSKLKKTYIIVYGKQNCEKSPIQIILDKYLKRHAKNKSILIFVNLLMTNQRYDPDLSLIIRIRNRNTNLQ